MNTCPLSLKKIINNCMQVCKPHIICQQSDMSSSSLHLSTIRHSMQPCFTSLQSHKQEITSCCDDNLSVNVNAPPLVFLSFSFLSTPQYYPVCAFIHYSCFCWPKIVIFVVCVCDIITIFTLLFCLKTILTECIYLCVCQFVFSRTEGLTYQIKLF